ncbi:MAG: hypothetical protein KAY37_00270 [Phycisphaerae bacterium]|nr:hypothetical protein [Phycisphaerae bacterium]
MTQEQLVAALKPHFPVITSLIRAAAEEFESFNIPTDRRPVVDGAPSGIMIYHLIWDRLERHFGFKSAIRVTESEGLKFLFFEKLGVSVRVNKLNAVSFNGSVSRTPGKLHAHPQLFFSFYDQPPGHLIFGYTARLNEQGVAVLDRVLLTLEGEDGVQWWTYVDVDGQADAPVEPAPGPTPPVVRPKALPEESKKVNGEAEAG